MSLLTNRQPVPSAAEYMAHGLSLADAEGLRTAGIAFEGAIDAMRAGGWKLKPELPRSNRQEAEWYAAGFRPVLLENGRLKIHVLGPWGRPPTIAAEDALTH